jgi:maltooligosyltrehalose trehalohydrolase
MTALLLLGPWTPLLFQGQEWNASSPFYYFADHHPELAQQVRKGRETFMLQFAGCAAGTARDRLSDPASPDTFDASRLCWEERTLPAHERALRLHQDLLALRRSDPTLQAAHAQMGVSLEIAALAPTCGVVRYFVDSPATGTTARDRLLLINLGPDLDLDSVAEPLLSPPTTPAQTSWRILWCSENPRYGGSGCAEPESNDGTWKIPGFAAVLLGPLDCV